ncbi:hypothetical protein OHT93_30425 [Streptomyces sp. NBC_00191]|uniref:hypothetical protein n=1 Tax=Streptomyces sp. NBC_00191 TaxID=2975674 RepID=UPI003246C1C6
MDEYARVLDRVETELAALSRMDDHGRDVWADSLGDLLESGCLNQADAERLVSRLVALAVTEATYEVRESALHAVSNAGVRYAIPVQVLEPLASRIDAFEPRLLEYVLFCLAATHDEESRAHVEPFLDHPAAGVREEAAQAIAELDAVRPGLRD